MSTSDTPLTEGVERGFLAEAPPRKPDRWHIVGLTVAALLTLALHALFLLCTGYNPAGPSTDAKRRAPECLLMPDKRTPTSHGQQLHLFARVFRPTALILPNTEHGFSAVRTKPRPRPSRSIPVFSPDYSFSAERPVTSAPLVAKAMDEHSALRNSWPLPLPPPPPVSPPGILPDNALWHTASGQHIDTLPTIPRAEVLALAADTPPGHPTHLEIQRLAGGIRIRVQSSSGNSRLDRLAVDAVRRILRPILLAGDVPTDASIPDILLPTGKEVVHLRADWPLLLSPRPEQPVGEKPPDDEGAQ